jgi:phosphatidylinositol alpha-1,6-mannosyltransferase
LILTLQTTTFGAFGGIPTYNRLICRVLNEITDGDKCDVLIVTDRAFDLERPSIEFSNLRLQAFDHNRVALTQRLARLALTQKFDLALIGHVNYAPLGWLLKRLQPHMRYAVILYGIEAWQQLPLLRRRALQQADFMISISEYTKRRAVEANVLTAHRVHLLPNALEWTNVKPASAVTQVPATAGTRLLSVCRLEQAEQYKGVDNVIEALPEIAKRVRDVDYVVIGGGTDLARHKKLAQEIGVAERVHFLGFLEDKALNAYYRDCDVFVLPSAGEGFGFVFLEAMKYGKPVVAANSGGAPEVVQDGITGTLVEYGNKEQLTQTLVSLCLDLNKRQRLGQAGYQRLQEEFTFARFKQGLTQILLEELRPNSVTDGYVAVINAETPRRNVDGFQD